MRKMFRVLGVLKSMECNSVVIAKTRRCEMCRFCGFFIGVQVLVYTIFVQGVRADTTYVSGIINTNTVWDTAGSPYIVIGNVLVDSSVTLTIEPGVEVRLDSAKYIMIKGTLNAIGVETDSIIITRNGTARWGSLWFKPASAGSLKYCRIEYAGNSAIFNSTASSLYIGYNTITNNSSGKRRSGGGIYNYYGSPTITHNTITNNTAVGSGDAYGGDGGGIYSYYGSPIITHNTITNNTATGLASTGGGICSYGSPIITHNTITNNTAAGYGGIYGNGGGICGGGIITGNTITNNTAADCGGGIYGSGTITGNTITNNTADQGGGIYIYGSGTITGNTITNNTAWYGGGIYSDGADTITGNTIANNTADYGGGIWSDGRYGSDIIKYNTITDTTASAIYIWRGNLFIRTNNISATGYAVYNNSANDIDARYNWWNTTRIDTIDEKIYDYYDDSTKGIVFYEPFLDEPFSDTIAPLAPIDLTANDSNPSPWTNDNKFEINWTNPSDESGISEYYYKLGTPPTGDFDTTGVFHYPPDTITATQQSGQLLYIWLVDSTGNLNYQNYASVNLRYDITAPIIDSTTVWEDTVDFWGPFEIKTKVTDNGEFHKPVMFYRTSTDTNWVARTMISMGGGWYVDSIPEQTQEDSIRIEYYLTAEDYATNTIRDPETGVYSFIVRRVGIEEYKKAPNKFVLFPPSPNPSLSSIVIKYGLPNKANISLSLYDISGRLVQTIYSGTQEKGYYTVNIKGLGKGIYFIKFKSNTFTSIKKLIILE